MASCISLLFLLLASLTPAHSHLKLPVYSRDKSFAAHLTQASQERDLFNPQDTSSAPHKVPLVFNSSSYVTNITIGTPPQTFTVLLNTLVTGIWVPSALCPVDKYNQCQNHRLYDQNASTTYMGLNQSAGLAGMTAEVSLDTVSLADMSVTNQSFAEVVEYDNGESYTPKPYDGLLGLGPSQTVFTNQSSVFANMLTQQLIDKNMYGLYFIKNSSSPANAGALIIGGREKSAYRGDLTYVDSTSQDRWEFEMGRFIVPGSEMPPLCTEGCKAVLNSGSHYIATSHRITDTLHRHLGAIVFADDYTYHFNCSRLSTLQTIYLSINQAVFTLPWRSYVDRVKDAKGETVCVSTFVGLDDVAGYDWYLGEAFFASVYVEFDADRQRVGFAQSVFTH